MSRTRRLRLRFGLIPLAASKPAAKKAAKKTVFGPYKGSDKNGGRPIMVIKKKDGSTTSTDAARYKYEKKTGKSLPEHMDVHHKDNGGRKGHDSMKNMSVMSHKKNVADGNRRRKVKK